MSDIENKEYLRAKQDAMTAGTDEYDKFTDWLEQEYTQTADGMGMWIDHDGVYFERQELLDDFFDDFYNELGE